MDYHPWYDIPTGNYESDVFDAVVDVRWSMVSWDWELYDGEDGATIIGNEGYIKVKIGVADDPAGPWAWSEGVTNSGGSLLPSSFSGGRYAKYSAELVTSRLDVTPVLKSIRLWYEYNALDGSFDYSTVAAKGPIVYARIGWRAEVPPGTTLTISVSRANGLPGTWIEANNGLSVIFASHPEALDSSLKDRFCVRVEMKSFDTSMTPRLYHIEMSFMSTPP
ncbi:unnamed protein product [marine sediment metagenome]|uniref:Uncharacterized protein n=1 Tax=marine sediment metagenome TaxID=412755 RepID=X0WFW9_9ZZZZ